MTIRPYKLREGARGGWGRGHNAALRKNLWDTVVGAGPKLSAYMMAFLTSERCVCRQGGLYIQLPLTAAAQFNATTNPSVSLSWVRF